MYIQIYTCIICCRILFGGSLEPVIIFVSPSIVWEYKRATDWQLEVRKSWFGFHSNFYGTIRDDNVHEMSWLSCTYRTEKNGNFEEPSLNAIKNSFWLLNATKVLGPLLDNNGSKVQNQLKFTWIKRTKATIEVEINANWSMKELPYIVCSGGSFFVSTLNAKYRSWCVKI